MDQPANTLKLQIQKVQVSVFLKNEEHLREDLDTGELQGLPKGHPNIPKRPPKDPLRAPKK